MLGFAWLAVPVPNEEGPLPLVLDVKVIVDRDPKQTIFVYIRFLPLGPLYRIFPGPCTGPWMVDALVFFQIIPAKFDISFHPPF